MSADWIEQGEDNLDAIENYLGELYVRMDSGENTERDQASQEEAKLAEIAVSTTILEIELPGSETTTNSLKIELNGEREIVSVEYYSHKFHSPVFDCRLNKVDEVSLWRFAERAVESYNAGKGK